MKLSLRFNIFFLIFFGIILSATSSTSATAQNLAKTEAQPPTGWHAVQSLPAETRIRLTTSKKKTTCYINSATEDNLVCSSSSSKAAKQTSYPKDEVTEIKLTNRSRSTLAGAAILAGAGAGIGALIGKATTSKDDWFPGLATGVGAAIGGISGAIAGGTLGYAKDWFAGPVIYHRP